MFSYARWHQARFSPLASRLLPATYGSFTCGNYRRALTKGYVSVDPHAPGHGEGRAVLWQPLGTAIQLLLTDTCQSSSQLAPATQKAAAMD